jgi:hypothetical protein
VCVCEDIDNRRSQQRLSHVNAIQRPGVQGTQLNSETGGCTMTLLALPCSGTAAQWPRFPREVVYCDLSFPACRMPYACSLLRIRESWIAHDMHNMARCMSTETFFGRSVSCYRLLTAWCLWITKCKMWKRKTHCLPTATPLVRHSRISPPTISNLIVALETQ